MASTGYQRPGLRPAGRWGGNRGIRIAAAWSTSPPVVLAAGIEGILAAVLASLDTVGVRTGIEGMRATLDQGI